MKRQGLLDRLPDFREASVAAYVAGFVISLALTASAFMLVWGYTSTDGEMFSRGSLIAMLAALAVAQITVQVLFFLHLSAERRLHFNVMALIFTVFAVLCIVVGSIWIMQNLDYNMMPQDQTETTERAEGITHH